MTTMNPQLQSGEVWYSGKDLKAEGEELPSNAIIIPFGLGVKYSLSSNLAIMADFSVKYTNTDLMDGTSSKAVNPLQLSTEAETFHMTLSDRRATNYTNAKANGTTFHNGNPDVNDLYGIFSIRLEYSLVPMKNNFKYKGRSSGPRHRRRPSRIFR